MSSTTAPDLRKLVAEAGAVAREPARVWPSLTFLLLAGLLACFAAEQRLAAKLPAAGVGFGGPGAAALFTLGGLSRAAVLAGEWDRLLLAPLLHANLPHLVANCTALVVAGWTLERLAGAAWTLCVFVVGGLAGSVASVALAPAGIVAVGASGAIMAMVTALFALSFRLRRDGARWRLHACLFGLLVTAMLPVRLAAGALPVDMGAHLGGAVCGALLGLLLLQSWQGGETLPPFRLGAAATACAALLATSCCVWGALQRLPTANAALPLIPPSAMPRTEEVSPDRAETLLRAYPNDPRAYILAGLSRRRSGDRRGAERLLRRGEELLAASPPGLFRPSVLSAVQGEIGLLLLARGRRAEAEATLRNACAATGDAALPAPLREALDNAALCRVDARS